MPELLANLAELAMILDRMTQPLEPQDDLGQVAPQIDAYLPDEFGFTHI